MNKKNRKKHLSSFQIIIFGFLFVILLGSILLMLPVSTKTGEGAPFLDALFTATSSVCVTGLVVHDTATYWSAFGQTIILLLIQIGGMGVVTMAVLIAIISGRKIGLMQRSTMQEAISAPQVGGIVKLTNFILKTAISIELLGAAIMAPIFCKEFGPLKGILYAIFHSISAFCNAGFDLMGEKAQFSSLTSYATQPVINVVIMMLIITGGIGFLTWEDIAVNKWHIQKYRMQTKVILLVTSMLIVFPTIYFYFCEFSKGIWSGCSTSERLLYALFQSVTPRTAGFNTADLTMLSEAGKMIMILLMLIGGSPGSTAGGMKTTTVAVLIASAIAVFRRREDANFFGRRVAEDTIKYAVTVLMMYLVLFLMGSIIISGIEEIPMLTSMFEAGSAIGTVGLTLGITPTLGVVSRVILIMLMFFGRVGGLTLVFAAVSGTRRQLSRLPQEKITVG
ncbi:MAG: Trk family potassium uptake protein [Anaerostipes sp.]|nr:Trk family potassium uptake protein [Anaerostipes sp.]